MGKDVVALLSDMDQPLGLAVGNANEVWEAVEMLEGGGPADLRELTLAQATEMLVLGQACTSEEAPARLQKALDSGSAREKFNAIVSAQGGDPKALDHEGAGLPKAPQMVPILAERAGFVRALDAEKIGRAAVVLGAGRAALEDLIDPAVGIALIRKRGDRVAVGDELCRVHLRDGRGQFQAEALIRAAYEIADAAPASQPLILGRLS
jgi:pyrimidine-nucleoside phosphorylase/thymidine phosphorylase